ncbi:PLP-dependent aminotransferase family protein [Achromobacter kerstersii]|uniref:aminotransferase-like domain-containing protein n=1 Tax=Achromobacter kerstersii TaxID=1353890 RepID=UPI00313EE104
MFTLDRQGRGTLVDQIYEGVQGLIHAGHWPVGARLPSVRRLASDLDVSIFTVSSAYSRLVSDGVLFSRVGAGFFVALPKPEILNAEHPGAVQRPDCAANVVLNAVDLGRYAVPAGSGFLPEDWMEDAIPPAVVGRLMRQEVSISTPVSVMGLPLLREQIASRLADIRINAQPTQIVTTCGATHAFSLVSGMLLGPGDTVVVEEPGYMMHKAQLVKTGASIVSVPRMADGPDLDMLEAVAKQYRPKAFVIQPVLHNPTGLTLSPACAYRLLMLAERYGFYVIEDDVFGSLCTERNLRLSSLDGLSRVFYISSFTKVLSPALRVGFVACPPAFCEPIIEAKILSVQHSSSLQETIVAHVLRSGRYQAHLSALRGRILKAHSAARLALSEVGVAFDGPPNDGLFLWGRLGAQVDIDGLIDAAFRDGIFLLRGTLFSVRGDFERHMRFNIGYSSDPRLCALLDRFRVGVASESMATDARARKRQA